MFSPIETLPCHPFPSSVLVTPWTSEETEFLKVRRRWCASARPAWCPQTMEKGLVVLVNWCITQTAWARLDFWEKTNTKKKYNKWLPKFGWSWDSGSDPACTKISWITRPAQRKGWSKIQGSAIIFLDIIVISLHWFEEKYQPKTPWLLRSIFWGFPVNFPLNQSNDSCVDLFFALFLICPLFWKNVPMKTSCSFVSPTFRYLANSTTKPALGDLGIPSNSFGRLRKKRNQDLSYFGRGSYSLFVFPGKSCRASRDLPAWNHHVVVIHLLHSVHNLFEVARLLVLLAQGPECPDGCLVT